MWTYTSMAVDQNPSPLMSSPNMRINENKVFVVMYLDIAIRVHSVSNLSSLWNTTSGVGTIQINPIMLWGRLSMSMYVCICMYLWQHVCQHDQSQTWFSLLQINSAIRCLVIPDA